MPPLRVLAVGNVYPPHHLGGYEIIWQGAMRALRDAGHEARVLTTGHKRSASAPEDDPEVYRELDWYWRAHAWRRLGPRACLRLERHNAEVFDRHVGSLRPHVIAWWPLGGLSLGLVERARRIGVPGVFFVLDPWLSYGPRHDLWLHTWSRLGPLRGLAEHAFGLPTRVDLGAAGRWVFCSAAMRDEALAARPEVGAGTILSPGVAAEYLRAPREPDAPPWAWRLLYVGRVVEQKGVRTAIEALAQLPDAATLTIVGEGDDAYRGELERLAERLSLRGRVRLEPARSHSELREVYRSADAVVFPVQWAEPFGLVPLEAMALGRPVIATGRGGSGDYLADQANALLFEAGDASSLAAALRTLGDDPRLRERLRRGGFETAERYSEERFNAGAIAQIERAAERRSRAGP